MIAIQQKAREIEELMWEIAEPVSLVAERSGVCPETIRRMLRHGRKPLFHNVAKLHIMLQRSATEKRKELNGQAYMHSFLARSKCVNPTLSSVLTSGAKRSQVRILPGAPFLLLRFDNFNDSGFFGLVTSIIPFPRRRLTNNGKWTTDNRQ